MATKVKTFSFASNAEGWVYHPAGALAGSWTGAAGNPSGCLQSGLPSAGTATGYWELHTNWRTLGFTIGDSARVEAIRLESASNRVTQGTVTVGPYQLYASHDDSLIGELWAGRGPVAGSESGWTTVASQPDLAIPVAISDLNDGIKLRLYHTHTHGGSPSQLQEDELQLVVDYTAVGKYLFDFGNFAFGTAGFSNTADPGITAGWAGSSGLGAAVPFSGALQSRLTTGGAVQSGYWETQFNYTPSGIAAYYGMRLTYYNQFAYVSPGTSCTIGPVTLHEPDGTLIGELVPARVASADDTFMHQLPDFVPIVAIPPEHQLPDAGLRLRLNYSMDPAAIEFLDTRALFDAVNLYVTIPGPVPPDPTPVGRSWDLVWHTLTPVSSDSFELQWDDHELIAADPLELQWDLWQLVGSGSQLQWHLGGQVGTELALFWEARQLVGSTPLQLQWDTRQLVGSTQQLQWDVWQLVGKDESLHWHTLFNVLLGLELRWQQRQLAGQGLQLQWHTLRSLRRQLELRWHVQPLSLYTPRNLELVQQLEQTMEALLQRRGQGGGGHNPHRFLELYGAGMIEPLEQEPDPATYRAGYYYNSRTNRLYRRVFDRYEPERGIIVAHWAGYGE